MNFESMTLNNLINEMQLCRSAENDVFHADGSEVSHEEWNSLAEAYTERYGADDELNIQFAISTMVDLGE